MINFWLFYSVKCLKINLLPCLQQKWNFFYTVIFSAQYLLSASNLFESPLTVFEISDVSKYFAKCSFSFTNLSPDNFLCYSKSFIPTKVLHTAHTTRIELEQNLLYCPFFPQFVKLLNITLDECSLFHSHLKSVFFIVMGREQNYTSASLQEDDK